MPEIVGEISIFLTHATQISFLLLNTFPPCIFYVWLKKKKIKKINTRMFQPFPQIPSPDKSSPVFVQSLLHKRIRALLNSPLQSLGFRKQLLKEEHRKICTELIDDYV